MAIYRLYLVGDGGHFRGWEKFECASDADAIAEARTKMGGYPRAELWHWGRPIAVITVQADAPLNGTSRNDARV